MTQVYNTTENNYAFTHNILEPVKSDHKHAPNMHVYTHTILYCLNEIKLIDVAHTWSIHPSKHTHTFKLPHSRSLFTHETFTNFWEVKFSPNTTFTNCGKQPSVGVSVGYTYYNAGRKWSTRMRLRRENLRRENSPASHREWTIWLCQQRISTLLEIPEQGHNGILACPNFDKHH